MSERQPSYDTIHYRYRTIETQILKLENKVDTIDKKVYRNDKDIELIMENVLNHREQLNRLNE